MIRVLQWGAGRNGQALIRAVARHRDLELVGCRVWSAAKDGVDAGLLAGIDALGVAATTDRERLLASQADVVLFLPWMRPDLQAENERDLIDLLRSGKNVVSLTGAHAMPSLLPDGRGAAIVAACHAGGATLAAAGVNPGFIAERLAPTLTGMCADVESVTIEETYLCLRAVTIGFGQPLAAWSRNSPHGTMFDEIFSQLVHSVAHALGIALSHVESAVSVTPAHRDIAHHSGLIRRGTVAAVSQEWRGVPLDPSQVIVTKRTTWVCAEDVPGHEIRSGWQITVRGLPNVIAEIRLDAESAAHHQPEAMVGGAIGMIPEVLAAPPGILLPTIFAPFRKAFVPVRQSGAALDGPR